ncbi:MAG: hypothetical protein A2808_02375 [Candidatus Moranbacteria bacterium RIFCSPHIGHO2_01_FULL_55_24]|nr:MAG: hypothetical protein A2808_02375 [Candidatus Moranbacteria bacterium RIFCSPHIGHO2_01_FULL_55_24]
MEKTLPLLGRGREAIIRQVAGSTLLNMTKRHMKFQPAIRLAMAELKAPLDPNEQYYVLYYFIPEFLDDMALDIVDSISPKLSGRWEEGCYFAAAFRRAAKQFRVYENKNKRLYCCLFLKTLEFARQRIPQKTVVLVDKGPRYYLRKLRRDPIAPIFVPALERLAA